VIFSIGHSNHPIENFLSLLERHGIVLLADVRSRPYSRFNPQFNRERLRRSLEAAGIEYLFLGTQLGARSQDPDCYENGRVQYERLARTAAFQEGLLRVREEGSQRRVALMCAEKEPLDCHRTILVARYLDGVQHILADGSLESHEAALDRLAQRLGVPPPDLFRTPNDVREDACRVQGQRIAYARPDEGSIEAGR
jgi:uncharacterized protein (DUF488 family)